MVVIGQISAEMVDSVNKLNPFGLIGMCIVLGVWVIGLWLNSRNRDRDAKTKIALAEQANIKDKQEAERQEREGFFESIRYIRDYTGTVRELVLETAKRNTGIDTRDEAMVKTLNSIADRLASLDKDYTLLAISEKTIADDLHSARELLEKIPIIESDVKEALEILRRVETELQMPIAKHGTLPTNNDQ